MVRGSEQVADDSSAVVGRSLTAGHHACRQQQRTTRDSVASTSPLTDAPPTPVPVATATFAVVLGALAVQVMMIVRDSLSGSSAYVQVTTRAAMEHAAGACSTAAVAFVAISSSGMSNVAEVLAIVAVAACTAAAAQGHRRPRTC